MKSVDRPNGLKQNKVAKDEYKVVILRTALLSKTSI